MKHHKARAKPGHIPEQPRVGTYLLRGENVEVFGKLDSDGGETYFAPEPGRLCRIKVGLKQDDWGDVLATLLHEALEVCLSRQSTAYWKSHFGAVNDPTTHVFIVSHSQMNEACTAVGVLLVKVIPDLLRVWTLARKPEKARPKGTQGA